MCLVPNEYNITNICEWIDQFESPVHNRDFDFRLATLFSTLWCIWKARNLRIFEDKKPNPYDILLSVNGYIKDFFKLNSVFSPKPSTLTPINLMVESNKKVEWRPPSDSNIKINSDT